MKRPLALLTLALIGSAGVAAAEKTAFKEQLTREEILAATKAAQDRLPPVDKAAAEKCAAMPHQTAAELEAAATCYRAAGSLGAAIIFWKLAVKESSSGAANQAALQQLGPANEASGRYSDAAVYHREYATKYAGEKDAVDHLIRAVCIWRQLGVADSADRAYQQLRALQKKAPPESATLCDTVRPIAPPPPEDR